MITSHLQISRELSAQFGRRAVQMMEAGHRWDHHFTSRERLLAARHGEIFQTMWQRIPEVISLGVTHNLASIVVGA
jgi:hypothetical protein